MPSPAILDEPADSTTTLAAYVQIAHRNDSARTVCKGPQAYCWWLQFLPHYTTVQKPARAMQNLYLQFCIAPLLVGTGKACANMERVPAHFKTRSLGGS